MSKAANSSAALSGEWVLASAEQTREVERFIFEEAALLDSWDLDRWLELVADDVSYVVPATDERDGNPALTLTFINDDIVRLRARVARLMSRRAFREYPWSRTRRMITNVRVDKEEGGPRYKVEANFTIHWFRSRRTATFVGRYVEILRRSPERLEIVYRLAVLDMEALDPHGAVSVIL